MEEKTIIKGMLFDEDHALVHSELGCARCGGTFKLTFAMSDAGIKAKYMRESIAKSYLERTAPAICPTCNR